MNWETVVELEAIVNELESGRQANGLLLAQNALTMARMAQAEYEEWAEGKARAEAAWLESGAQLLADLTGATKEECEVPF